MLKALIVEDHKLMRLSVMKVVRDHFDRCIVRGAATLDLALQLTEECDFDLVLTDLTLPGMDPTSASVRLNVARRMIAAAPDAIHVVITGADDDDEAAACKRLGASGYLCKDTFDASALGAALGQVGGGTFARWRTLSNDPTAELLCTGLTPREEEIINLMLQRPPGTPRAEVFRQKAERDGIDDLSCMHYYKQARAKLLRAGMLPVHA